MAALFIVNPISGSKRKKKRVVEFLRKNGCSIVFTEYAGHATRIAREAVEDTVVAVGGDGTVNEVAKGLIGTGKTLGIIPCGSGNGLAYCLGLCGSLKHSLDIITDGHAEPLDYGTIDGKEFFSVCGVGLDAIVSAGFAKSPSRGLKTYIVEAVRIWRRFKPDDYSITVDGNRSTLTAALVTVGNSDQWGNRARITPLADTGDGLLDVCVLEMFRTWEIPALVWRLMTGSMDRSRRVRYFRGRDIVIERPSEGPAHFDGDYVEAPATVHVRLEPQRLNILTRPRPHR